MRHMKLTNSMRTSTLLTACLATLIVVAPAVSASPEPGADVPGCRYSLTSQMISLSGDTSTVKASFTPTQCASNANVNDLTVCLSAPDGRSDCARRSGWGLVEVTLPVANTPGTFTATGKACLMDVLGALRPVCENAAPVSITA